MRAPSRVGYLGGSFDMFRVDHLDQFAAGHQSCDILVVGVYSDDLVVTQTGKTPLIPFAERLEIVRSMRGADVTVGQSSEFLSDIWQQVRFDVAFVPHAVDASHTDYEQMTSVGVDIVPLAPGRTTSSALKHHVSA